MQLYALDEQGDAIAAGRAERQADYHCLECGSLVRLRSGPHRQPHFFHLVGVDSCRQNGKTLVHLQAQRWLERLLGSENCLLERRFPSIGRVADAVWLPHNIVFEVQCSPITVEEVQQRNRDYATLGYQVVWLLHDARFNAKRLSAAELYLRQHPSYFINVNAEGIGEVYDQFEHIDRGVRSQRLPPLQVDLSKPVRNNPRARIWLCSCVKRLPKFNHATSQLTVVRQRLDRYPLYFCGDLVDLSLQSPQPEYITQARALEAATVPQHHTSLRDLWRRWVAYPYTAILHALLEKASR